MPSPHRHEEPKGVGAKITTAPKARRQGGHVTRMQRLRLLTATFELIGDGGVPAVTVASVSQRAGVSRRTFYELFDDREACLAAAFDHAVSRASEAVTTSFDREREWHAAMRAGLTALLGFLDDNPPLARLLIVEAVAIGPAVIERRAQIGDRLIAAVDEGRTEAGVGQAQPPLTAEAIVGAVLSVIQSLLLEREHGRSRPSLREMTGHLMSVVVHPYLGAAVAQAEIDAPAPTQTLRKSDAGETVVLDEPFKDLPMRLPYRIARVLGSIAEAPGASSRQVAEAAGVSDEGQMSRLLSRLERYELIENRGGQPSRGEAKAWTLTARGRGVVRAVGAA